MLKNDFVKRSVRASPRPPDPKNNKTCQETLSFIQYN